MTEAMTAADIFLGVAPLIIISGTEHYDDIVRPLQCYKNFTSKLQQLRDEIETERTIFRLECQLLLTTVRLWTLVLRQRCFATRTIRYGQTRTSATTSICISDPRDQHSY